MFWVVRSSGIYPVRKNGIGHKKELLAKKAKIEQEKMDEIRNQIKQNSSDSTIQTMKSMNVSEDVVKQVQKKIETEARENVQSVMGHAGYETFD